MDKKTYITPEMEIVPIETVEMMAASGGETVNVFGTTTDADAMVTNNRRGTWGNLWNRDE